MGVLFVFVFIVTFCLLLPIGLTCANIWFLVAKDKTKKIFNKELTIEFLTLILGPIYSYFCLKVLEIMTIDWPQVLFDRQRHSPLNVESLPTIIVITVIGILAYSYLRVKKTIEIPPVLFVLANAAMYLGIILCVLWIIQISNWSMDFYLILFPFNCILLALKNMKYSIMSIQEAKLAGTEQLKLNEKKQYGYYLLSQSQNWPWLSFLSLIPILIILVSFLLLFKQKPDALIKAWTETSDWNLSQQKAPMNIVSDQHYLCSVAAQGHPKVVKPLRMGVRHSNPVVVNRQLCIANAFEEIFAEKSPHMHRLIRRFYDNYGYPFAQHVSSPLVMDSIYLVMKPLEWFFLVVIYASDCQPENRIAMQYIPRMPDKSCDEQP